MWGLQMAGDAAPIIDGARERGLLVNRTQTTVVRMLPPLTIDIPTLDRALDILDAVCAAQPVEVHA